MTEPTTMESETTESVAEGIPTLLRKEGIQKRMQCSGLIAHNIEGAFASVPSLLEAIESDDPLTDNDGIGSETAKVIMDWNEHREERERAMPQSSITERSVNSATISFHTSWAEELGMEVDDDG